MFLKTTLLATFGAALLCTGALADDTAKAADAEATASIKKGLAWLAANEVDGKGYWGDPKFPGMTGLVLWALVGSGDAQYKPQIDRAVDYILSCAQKNGGIYVENPDRKGGGLGTYNTAICLTALHAARAKDPKVLPVLLKARTYIANSQLEGDPSDDYHGGFGYDRVNDRAYTDLMNTHFCIEAMRRSQELEDLRPAGQPRADINWKTALQYVEKMQNTNGDDAGGFFYNPNDAKAGTRTTPEGKVVLRSYGSITYAGLLSLIYCEIKRDDPRVVSAVDYASRHWTLEENPGVGQSGLYFYMNVMGRAFSAARMDAIPRKDGGAPIQWREEVIKRLASLQKEDGSWSNSDNRWWESDPALATSYSLLALEFATSKTK